MSNFRTLGGKLYFFTFWGLVAYAAYSLRGWYDTTVVGTVNRFIAGNEVTNNSTGEAYGQVLLFLIVVATFAFTAYLYNAIWNTSVAVFQKITNTAPQATDGKNFEDSVLKNARRMERLKDFRGAGEAFESVEYWVDAARCFEKAGESSRAAQAFENAGEISAAVDIYERDSNYVAAATLCAKDGQRERASKNFRAAAETALEQNSFVKAAEYYERGGDLRRAGTVYENAKRDREALRCYAKGGVVDKVEELLGRIDIDQVFVRGENFGETVRACAELLVKEGRLLRGAEIFESARDYVRAAETFEAAGEWERSGEAFFKGEFFDKALAAYERSADTAKVTEFRGRVALARGDFEEAGRHFADSGKNQQAVDAFKRAKDFAAAAGVYEKMDRHLLAAEMYSSAKNFGDAARAFAKANDWRNAAECFETANDLEQAAQAYANAGDYFRAGKMAMSRLQPARAIEFLQRVPPDSGDYSLAMAFLGAAFYDQSRRSSARELFDVHAGSLPATADTLPVLYRYARLIEADDTDKALQLYRRIETFDLHYEDVAIRLRNIEARRSGSSASLTPIPQASSYMPPPLQVGTPPAREMAPPTVRTKSPTETMVREMEVTAEQSLETRFGEDGRFQLLHELGRSGMSIVYKAIDTKVNREVALKTLPVVHGQEAAAQSAINDVRSVTRLAHPNIATVFDVGRMNDLFYFATEFVTGESLRQSVRRKGPMSLDDVRRVLRQVGDALNFAHMNKLLHLDLRPSSLMVNESQSIKILDFGVARLLQAIVTQSDKISSSGTGGSRTVLSAPQFQAPEQILGGVVDERTDIYTLGLTLFFLLTGRTPFDVRKVTDPIEISRLQLSSSFPRPSTLRATLPTRIDDIFLRCTQKSAQDRYPNVDAFLNDLATVN